MTKKKNTTPAPPVTHLHQGTTFTRAEFDLLRAALGVTDAEAPVLAACFAVAASGSWTVYRHGVTK